MPKTQDNKKSIISLIAEQILVFKLQALALLEKLKTCLQVSNELYLSVLPYR